MRVSPHRAFTAGAGGLVREFERLPAEKQAELVASLEWMVAALGITHDEQPAAV
jgi:hypothetical protein